MITSREITLSLRSEVDIRDTIQITVFLYLEEGIPVRIEARGFFLPPSRAQVAAALEEIGFKVGLGTWTPVFEEDDHPTWWQSQVAPIAEGLAVHKKRGREGW